MNVGVEANAHVHHGRRCAVNGDAVGGDSHRREPNGVDRLDREAKLLAMRCTLRQCGLHLRGIDQWPSDRRKRHNIALERCAADAVTVAAHAALTVYKTVPSRRDE